MILGNLSQFGANPVRTVGSWNATNMNFRPTFMYAWYDPDTTTTRKTANNSFPTGTESHYSLVLAPKGGEFSNTTGIVGTGAVSGSLIMARQLASTDLNGAGTVQGSLSLLSQLASALAGVGALQGTMKLNLAFATTLSGVGALTPSMSLLVGMISSIGGSGTVSANLTGIARLEASIFVNVSTATVNELVAGVWNALAADYNDTGTMGEAMNGAGSAGNPWITDLSGYNTSGTAGKILKDRLSKSQFLGLK